MLKIVLLPFEKHKAFEKENNILSFNQTSGYSLITKSAFVLFGFFFRLLKLHSGQCHRK